MRTKLAALIGIVLIVVVAWPISINDDSTSADPTC